MGPTYAAFKSYQSYRNFEFPTNKERSGQNYDRETSIYYLVYFWLDISKALNDTEEQANMNTSHQPETDAQLN